MQHLRALRVAKKLKREALAKKEEELLAQVDVTEEEPEKENDSDSGSEDSGGEEDCKITDNEEQEPVQASDTSALDTLIASSQKHGAFDNTAFAYQREPEPSKRTLLRKSRQERELRKAAENTPTLHTFFSTVSGRPATPVSPTPSTNERKQPKVSEHCPKLLIQCPPSPSS